MRPGRAGYKMIHVVSRELGERAACLLELWDVVLMVSYYGSVVYANFKEKSKVTKSYEEEYMEITAEVFCRWALDLIIGATPDQRRRHQARVLLLSICVTQYIGGPGYSPRDEDSVESQRLRPREAKVKLGVHSRVLERSRGSGGH